jgi:DNA replication and repair protein RecF
VCGVVESFRVSGLRNVREAELALTGTSALICGANGAGKTTLLEGLYLLARGRTFRGRRAGDLTTNGLSETRVGGRVRLNPGVADWLFWRSGRSSGRWVDGIVAGECRDLRQRLTVRLVGENAQQLFEGEPGLRRRFLDWNFSHMDSAYDAVLCRFRQVLEQRNAWLRQGGRGRRVWDEELLAAGGRLDLLRQQGLGRINLCFMDLARRFPNLSGVELDYLSGIPRGKSFQDALFADGPGERLVGYTRVGPQRADFRLSRGGRAVVLSRGQQKGVVCLIQLACGAVQESLSGIGEVWLLDDLWGDLDQESVSLLLPMFLERGRQCVLTRIGSDTGTTGKLLPSDTKLFHVEQGKISPRS